MLTIALDAVPNQSLTVPLDGARWDIEIKKARDHMVMTLARDGVTLVSGHRVVAGSPLPPYRYNQIYGTFWLVTDGELEPDYKRFGVDQVLVFVPPGEVV